MNRKYIARFRNVKGRYLVEREGGGSFGGQKIVNAKRQQAFGNQPDPETGLYLNEMYRVFHESEIVSLKEVKA